MSYLLRYSPEALSDLDDVWDGVLNASQSPDTAERYVRELMEKVSEKKDFPASGIPLYYRGLFTGFYSVNYKAYKAFYRVRDDRMEVLRVLFGESE